MMTKPGVEKRRLTMIKKYGSEENYKAFLREAAALGGSKTNGYKFAYGKVAPSEAGKKGGRPKNVR